MKARIKKLLIGMGLVLAFNAQLATTRAQGTAFNYNGSLNVNGTPANGSYDVTFTLYATSNGVSAAAGPVTNLATAVSNGLFTASIDFGAGVFTGGSEWLEVAVRTNGGSGFTTLAPRQQILPAPYAIYSANAGNAATATSAGTANSVSATNIAGTIPLGQLPGAVITNNQTGVVLNGTFIGNGAGITNVNLMTANSSGAITWTSTGSTNLSGIFTLASSPGAGPGPAPVLAFTNTDGKVDLVCGDTGNNSLALLTNNGSGGFAIGATYSVPSQPYSITMADVNGDGKPDIIAANYSGSSLTILTNNGSGGFAIASSPYTSGSFPRSVVAFTNFDGRVFLVCADYYQSSLLVVLTNDGHGNFSTLTTISAPGNPVSVTVADVNGDGKMDLICANWGSNGSSNSVTVLTNNGSGGFGPGVNYTVGYGPIFVTTADVNGDGRPDIITANYIDNTLTVLTNNGSGGFALSATLSVGFQPWSVTAADVNGDHRVDLISANGGTNTLTVYTNNGSGGFVLLTNLSVGANPLTVAAVDVNGDGAVDLVSANNGANTLSVLLNTPGSQGPPTITATFNGNGSGLTNLSASQITSGTLPSAQLPATVVTNTETGVTLSGTFNGNGAGLTNLQSSGGSGLSWQNVTGTSQQAQPNTGYLANNAGQVIITLPASPNLGDIVRVSGVGTGGWEIAQNSGQSIQAGSFGGAYAYGTLLTNWTQTSAPITNWQSIATSTDGTKLVAVVYGGGIYTSANSGTTWAQTTAPTTNWLSVCSSADGTKLAAVVLGGGIYYSINSGANWTQSDATNSGWDTIASSSDGTKLLAQTQNNLNNTIDGVYLSTNSGANWIQSSLTVGPTGAVASSANGTELILAAYFYGIYVSTNSGATWDYDLNGIPYYGVGHGDWRGVACSTDGSKVVAVQDNTGYGIGSIYTSTNAGSNWSLTSAPTNLNWVSVASSADGIKLAAFVANGGFYLSSDSGTTWQQASAPTNNPENFDGYGRYIASSAGGNELFEVIYGGGIWMDQATVLPTTTPGTAGYISGGQNTAVELQYTGNGQWLPLSYVGTISAH